MKNKILIMLAFAFMVLLSGCAKKNLVIDMGKGDEVHLMGGADNFDCDDPAYAGIEKVHTWEMQFADGTTRHLCARKNSVPTNNLEPAIQPQHEAKPIIIQPERALHAIPPADVCVGAGCPHAN